MTYKPIHASILTSNPINTTSYQVQHAIYTILSLSPAVMALSQSYSVPLAIFMVLFVQTMSAGIDGNWYNARATFYGDMAGHETMRKCILNFL